MLTPAALVLVTVLQTPAAHPPLVAADVDAIGTLLKLEDTRTFDEEALGAALKAEHPEVRRRAILAVGRIAAKPVGPVPGVLNAVERAHALLEPLHAEKDTTLLAIVAFAHGEMKDADSVAWLGDLLNGVKTPAPVAREAACALGKIRNPATHVALAKYLTDAPLSAPALVAGEALLAMGRFPPEDNITPVLRWIASKDVEIRWRATWALVRSRSTAGVAPLLKLATDRSPEVRFWAMRGLSPALADAAHVDRATTSARLRDGVKDADRRVRTEALRALGAYDDDASFAVVVAALDSPDTWLSVSAAEALANAKARVAAATPKLIAAAAPSRPAALRSTALASLVALGATDAATADIAAAQSKDPSLTIRGRAQQALVRLGDAGRQHMEALANDPATKDLLVQPGTGRGGNAGAASARPARPSKTDAEYRAIVTRWIVPDYNGAPKPRAIWETEKGTLEIELFAGDAPIAMEYFVKAVDSHDIVGTEFGRVVPNFVAQQRAIAGAPVIRDEVHLGGLRRATVSWASAGLDTGRPGYTLASTPQPHNEGDFTALGRVVRGMDVVDAIELGDRITAARMVTSTVQR